MAGFSNNWKEAVVKPARVVLVAASCFSIVFISALSIAKAQYPELPQFIQGAGRQMARKLLRAA